MTDIPTSSTSPMPADHNPPKAKMPPQVPYIIGNEGCERFSFYGMRNVLTTFLISYLLLDVPEIERAVAAKDVMHTFIIGVYFFPLLGGWLSDKFLGKFNTIYYLSIVYCVGHLCLAVFESYRPGFYFGLVLIALGSGGIKPCVSSFIGDQFDASNKHLAKVVFDAFYWIINFGSFFASLLIPVLLKYVGPSVAFGVPGILMFIATVVLWLGRKQYVITPPQPSDPNGFAKIVRAALLEKEGGTRVGLGIALTFGLGAILAATQFPVLGFVSTFCIILVLLIAGIGIGTWLQLSRVEARFAADDVAGVRAVLRVLVLFALVTPFWSLFDQKTSTWVIQAGTMTKPDWFQPSQMQALNPLLVMTLIPLNNLVLYPALRALGLQVTALRRMGAGIAFSGLAWIVVGALQLRLDDGDALTIVWQVLPYALLTFGEVLVSATGLEFAYSQAPVKMKGVIMSFWSLSVTIGNLWVLLVNTAVKNDSMEARLTSLTGMSSIASQMFFFAIFAFVAAAAFALVARRYQMVDNYRTA